MKLRSYLNRVPEITLYFWIIKILCTTVGETAADFLSTNLNFGLTGTSVVMSIILIIALIFQFHSKQYKPSIYWLAVVLLSIVGTLITDNITDNFGVSLKTTSFIFSVVLALVFTIWYKVEKTLSVHSISTPLRESFYWLAILFTFALGTATGDLIAETFSVGYLLTAVLFGGIIATTYIGYKYLNLNAVFAFWVAYIITRPLGASIGDYLSQAKSDGGLGLGTVITSSLFLITILCAVIYLIISKKDIASSEIFN